LSCVWRRSRRRRAAIKAVCFECRASHSVVDRLHILAWRPGRRSNSGPFANAANDVNAMTVDRIPCINPDCRRTAPAGKTGRTRVVHGKNRPLTKQSRRRPARRRRQNSAIEIQITRHHMRGRVAMLGRRLRITVRQVDSREPLYRVVRLDDLRKQSFIARQIGSFK